MCEFCPIVGRCCVCEHFTAVDPRDLKGSPTPAFVPPLDLLSEDGFVVEHRGVAIRFSHYKDVIAVTNRFSTARVRN